jgi:hypothetical protein
MTKQKEIVEQLKKLEKMKNYSQVREQSTDMMKAVIILVHHSIQEKHEGSFTFDFVGFFDLCSKQVLHISKLQRINLLITEQGTYKRKSWKL